MQQDAKVQYYKTKMERGKEDVSFRLWQGHYSSGVVA
jgi:hypothetical protein